ncbi:elongation factor-2 kinase [Ramaria rubella]|nr:elongation factor-2 kinase [Ramaria rubella]
MDEDMDFDGATQPPEQHQVATEYPQTTPNVPPNSVPSDGSGKMLDLVFIQDCTGSQGSYISSATKNIEEICASIFASGKLVHQEDLRVGLVAFRDHPPQDHTYVTRTTPFTSDIKKVHEVLKTLYASGGGDGPEAVTAALGEALAMNWRENASKMVVLIADAPPHGIGEYGDGFDDGSPDGLDPLQIVRQMAQRGITLFFVACEPALSGYSYATDFYQAITTISSGLMLPLTTANLLSHAIIGSVLENLDMERLIREVGQAVAQRILGNQESVDDVARELHEKLLLRNESTKKIVFENIYRESAEAKHNVQVFSEAPTLSAARPLLKKVHGSRFTEKYLSVRQHGRSTYSSYGYIPYRPTTPTSPIALAPSPGPSPPRKVVSDFAAFGAPTSSVFGTKVASTPFSLAGGKAAFGAIRNGSNKGAYGADEDDDEEQKIQFREGAITFDQAKRIAMQSAWRGTRS